MATQPDIPPPERTDPPGPAEMPPGALPDDYPGDTPPELVPDTPDRDLPCISPVQRRLVAVSPRVRPILSIRTGDSVQPARSPPPL